MDSPNSSDGARRPGAFLSDGALAVIAALALAVGAWVTTSSAAEQAVQLPPAAFDPAPAAVSTSQTAVFAGGCFWGVQAVFQHTAGVLGAVSGYAGGQAGDANYQAVVTGATEHAEAVQVRYDPRRISYGELLRIFFSVAHDPTQLNRQGPDVGPQYRSAIFTADATQQQVAARYIAQLETAKAFPAKIVTQLSPLTAFHRAEAYHQDYATLHPESPYIVVFDRPKIANLKAVFPARYREKPVLVGRSQM
jgi:peptide-methionine (S)-S-oxide reductase